ncbi:MAG: helix-turn-helix transcriptional regulator [Kiritimatiellales bacterium]|nr:helix-turn-helix transcriptional regulator [Kiritimatiellota bacterium]MBL7012323.1 helix-turn-helix transcriptional regulator [Kiritimatiellales bacterium]
MKRSIDGEMVKGHTEMLILALLNDRGPMHGYRIRQELADLSNRTVHPSFGRLYPLLAWMEKTGWLKSRTEIVCKNRERKVYRITSRGATELKVRALKWEKFSGGINRLLKNCKT